MTFFFRPCPFAPGVIIIKRLSAVRIFFFRSDCGEMSLPFLDSRKDLGPPNSTMVKVTSREKEEDSSSFSYLGILCTQTKLTVSRRQGEEEELEEGGEHLKKRKKKEKWGQKHIFHIRDNIGGRRFDNLFIPPPNKKASNLGQPTNQETRREDNLCLPPFSSLVSGGECPGAPHSCVSELWAHQRPIFTVGPRGLAFGRTVPWGDPKYNETYSVFRFIPQPPPREPRFFIKACEVVNSILLANISPRTKDIIGVMFFEASKFFLGSSKNWARS